MKNVTKIIIITAIMAVIILSGNAAAENITNQTGINQTEYEEQLNYWYNYYTESRTSGYESKLRVELDNYLHSTTLSAKDWNDAILIKLGWDFRLDYYTNPEKHTIDENTGAVTYDLGIANWWAKLFGNGIREETLPQTTAEGDALLKIYQENYSIWISVLKDYKEENR